MSELIFAIANLQKYFKDNLRRIEALFKKKSGKLKQLITAGARLHVPVSASIFCVGKCNFPC